MSVNLHTQCTRRYEFPVSARLAGRIKQFKATWITWFKSRSNDKWGHGPNQMPRVSKTYVDERAETDGYLRRPR